ncbi:TPA: BatD family protein [Serratia odorifera]|nr:BatD family protein [Serratia odorifera]
MRAVLLLLLALVIPAHAAIDITRELIAPQQVVPGQPLRIAVTYWTDSWFNPPPEWPAFKLENGSLLTTPLPNQLLSRRKNGISWSGIRQERQVIAWDQGWLNLPATEVTLSSANQPPVTVTLPALKTAVSWPAGLEQPDRFLPAEHLTLSQKIRQFHAVNDGQLHAGDVVERIVTVKAGGVIATQIPQLLYAIPGTETQRLAPINTLLKTGRGDIGDAQRIETLRYLPSQAGSVTLPPIVLRWWDTTRQQWQVAQLPGTTLPVASTRAAGSESVLRGTSARGQWQAAIGGVSLSLIALLLWLARRPLWRSLKYCHHGWRRFWQPIPLAQLTPNKRGKR